MKDSIIQYTCNDYRSEMILISLNKKLTDPGLSEKDRQDIHKEIKRLEKQMGMA
jgi:hypothetical protein